MTERLKTGFSVPKGKRYCTICGEIKRENCFEADSDRCNDCIGKMLNTKVKWYYLPIVLIFIAAAVISVYITSVSVPFIKSVNEAQAVAESGRLYDAFDIFENEILSKSQKINEALVESFGFLKDTDLFVPGTKTFEKYCDICSEADSEYEAGALVNELFDKDYIEKNETFSMYNAISDAYDKVTSKVEKINEQYAFTSAKDMKYEEIIKAIDSEAENSDFYAEKGFFEYFKASATQYYFEGKKEQYAEVKKCLDKMLELLPGEYTVYGTTLADIALKSGDYDSVIEMAELVLGKNKNVTRAYEWLAQAYYKKGDTARTFEIIEELNDFVPDSPTYYKLLIKYNLLEGDIKAAEKASIDGDSKNSETADAVFNLYLSKKPEQITRSEAQVFDENIEFTAYQCALLLIKGDSTTAFEVSYNYAYYYAYYYAYLTGDTSLLSQSIINMTTLCAKLCEDKDALEDISQYGLCDENTQKVIDGVLSLEDVFIHGKADIL